MKYMDHIQVDKALSTIHKQDRLLLSIIILVYQRYDRLFYSNQKP